MIQVILLISLVRKQGHIKIEGFNITKEKEKVGDRKKEKKAKEIRAYVAWEGNDDSTSSS